MGFVIFVSVSASVLFAMHGYTVFRLAHWMGEPLSWKALWAVGGFIAFFFAYRMLHELWVIAEMAPIMRLIFLVMSWFLLAMPIVLLVDVVLSLFKIGVLFNLYQANKIQAFITAPVLGYSVLSLIFIVFSVGVFNFYKPLAIETITLSSNKVSRPYYLLHISDLQFGSTGPRHVRKVRVAMDQALEEYPIDAVVNTGDHIDSANYRDEDLALLQVKGVPNFFSLGNHEFYHAPDRILETMNELGNHILRHEKASFQDLNFIGIDDARSPKTVEQAFNQKPLIDDERFNVLLYHRPTGVDAAAKAGVDLMLSGHTHGGQFYPYVWALNFFYKYQQGVNQIGDMLLYVTDGAGLWGPSLRLGSRNEIAVIEVKPKTP